MVAAMSAVATEAPIFQGLMYVFLAEIRIIMARKTELSLGSWQKILVIRGMRIVAIPAFPLLDGAMKIFEPQTKFLILVALQTKSHTPFFQSESPDQTMRLVTAQAFILGKGFVLSGPLEIPFVMAFLTFSLLGESLAFFDLRFRGRSEKKQKGKKR